MAVRRMPTESDEVRVRFLFLDVCGDFDPFAPHQLVANARRRAEPSLARSGAMAAVAA